MLRNKTQTLLLCLTLPTFIQAQTNCHPQLTQKLKTLGSQNQWHPGPPSPIGLRTKLTPTAKLGRWLALTQDDFATPSLTIYTETKTEVITWNAACKETRRVDTHPRPKRTKSPVPRFTDTVFKQLLKRHPHGVVYLWSPYMEISVLGLKEARKAATALRIPLIAVASRYSPTQDVLKSADSLRLKHVYLADSFELKMRQMDQHFPSLIVFAKNAITSKVRRGHENAKVYRKFFEDHIGRMQVGTAR